MNTDELITLIPPSVEYSFTVQRLGYHYSCFLKIINGKQITKFNVSSNDLEVALKGLSEKLKSHIASIEKLATA